jgi:hypothetical protein
MHKVIASPATALDGVAESLEKWLHHNDETGKAARGAAAQANTIRLGRPVNARDLHPGDIIQQHDWSLHVREVEIGRAVVAVVVTEFGFHLHYAADEMLQVAI